MTVQPGFTLWGIAEGQLGDGIRYVQVFEANKDKIRDPNLIYPGRCSRFPRPSREMGHPAPHRRGTAQPTARPVRTAG